MNSNELYQFYVTLSSFSNWPVFSAFFSQWLELIEEVAVRFHIHYIAQTHMDLTHFKKYK